MGIQPLLKSGAAAVAVALLLSGCANATEAMVCEEYSVLREDVANGTGIYDNALFRSAGKLGRLAAKLEGNDAVNEDGEQLKKIEDAGESSVEEVESASRNIARLCGRSLDGKAIATNRTSPAKAPVKPLAEIQPPTPRPTIDPSKETSPEDGARLASDGSCTAQTGSAVPKPSKEVKPFLEQFVLALCTGNREALKPFATEAALSELDEIGFGPLEAGAKYRLDWLDDCMPAESGAGSCGLTYLTPEGGSGLLVDAIYFRTSGNDVAIRSFEFFGGGA